MSDGARPWLGHRLRHLLSRFPEHERSIHDLHGSNAEFQALCDEYTDVAEQLEGLSSEDQSDAPEQIHELRHRRAALEEQLLGIIEGISRP